MTIPGGLGAISLQTVGEAIAFTAGFAAARALEPVGVGLAQDAWNVAPIRAVDAATAAQIAAERVAVHDWAEQQARLTGIGSDTFEHLYQEALNAPGFGELVRMLRRGTIDPDDFEHGLQKDKLEDRWTTPLEDLQHERIDPSALATAIHRGIIAGAGLLVREPPEGEGNVPHVQQSSIDALTEAAAWGIDPERLRVLVGNTGLPLSLGEMLQLLNRGDVTEDDVRRSIAQSNVRNEYMDVALYLRRRLLTPHEYEEAALRGIISNADADAGAALSGMEATDAQLLFQIMGRPLAVHQITTGLARGGDYGGSYDDVPEPYRDAIRRSSIRPEYAKLAYANRYNYPSAFVLRSLTQAGELTEQEAHDILLYEGWEPTLAAKVAAQWAGGTGAKADPHITKAESQLWTALHRAYINDEAPAALAGTTLTAIGVADTSHADVLALWDHERALIRAQLTPSQIKKAVGQPGKDQAWAMERLGELGYSPDDATAFLAE